MKSAGFHHAKVLSTAHITLSVLIAVCLIAVLYELPVAKLPPPGSPLRIAGLLFLSATVVYLGLTSVAELSVGLDWRRDAGKVTQTLLRGIAHGIVLFALGLVAARGTESRVFAIGQGGLLPSLLMTGGIATALAWYGQSIALTKKPQARRASNFGSHERFRRIVVACSAAAGIGVAICLAMVEVQTVPQPGGEIAGAKQVRLSSLTR